MPTYPQSPVFYRNLGRPFPIAVSGRGAWIVDDRGAEYLDASGGALVASIGHGVEEVAEAIGLQAANLAYASAALFSNLAAEELAGELASIAPSSLGYFYFLCSGSEAVEASVKLARQYWVERGRPGKWKILSRVPSYHGNTLTALSVSGREHYRTTFGPLLTEFPRVPAPDPYRHPDCDHCTGESVVREIERQGPESIAAFLAEPIIGSSLGATVPSKEYYRRIRDACHAHDVLFLADEVMAGMGRTGRWFSFEHFDFVPDVAILGKGISGGYAPLSAVAASREIVDTIARGSGAFSHAQTYSHTPVICAAGTAAIRYIKKHDLIARSAHFETQFFAALDRLKGHWAVGDIRGRGLMAGIEVVADRETRRPFPRSDHIAERLSRAALARGLVVWVNSGHLPSGVGDIVMLGPPFTIDPTELDEIATRLGLALEDVLGH